MALTELVVVRRSYNCTPVSLPALPSLAAHPLWAAWEHTLDLALAQLPRLLRPEPDDYTHSPFFRDQLTAFQVWLDLGKCKYSHEFPATSSAACDMGGVLAVTNITKDG